MARARAIGPSSARWPLAGLAVLSVGVAVATVAGCQQTVVFERADGGGGDDGGANSTVCPAGIALDVLPESPVVIVALDRATSMNDPFGTSPGAPSKLYAARDALLNVVKHYQAVVQFGYIGFPGIDTGTCSPETCCSFIDKTTPTLNIADYFEAELSACDGPTNICAVGFDRPTASALEVAQSSLANPGPNNHVGNRAVVLVTDGAPGCAGGSNDPCNDAQNEVSYLANSFVRTNVVGLGTAPDDRCFKKLVTTGSGTYQSPSRPQDLQTTLDAMVQPIAAGACRLDVFSNNPIDPSHLHVYLKGKDVPQSDTNGWTWQGPQPQIVLTGDACDAFITTGLASSSQPGGALFYDCGGNHH